MSADESCALVRYFPSELVDGPGFSSMERLEFTGDQIRHIDVYFGREFARISTATDG